MRTTVQHPRVNLMLIGAPASGKGTQAALLVEHLDIPSIATGNILRTELVQRTELGLRAEAHMQRGELVPDALMIDIIRQRFAAVADATASCSTVFHAPWRRHGHSTRQRRPWPSASTASSTWMCPRVS